MVKLLTAAAAATMLAATPASAAEFIFKFSGNSATSGTDGNASIFSARSGADTLNVRATGWSVDGGGAVRDSFLGRYSHGLGVTSGDESGSRNTHVVDNQNRYDFVLLQFSEAVALSAAMFNSFSVNGLRLDNDATIAWGTSPRAWNAGLGFNNTSIGAVSSHFAGSLTSVGTGASGWRAFDAGQASANLWLIGGAMDNRDHRVDGFKLGGIAASTMSAVPEPATWAMMIIGFGMIGSAVRYRGRRRSVAFA